MDPKKFEHEMKMQFEMSTQQSPVDQDRAIADRIDQFDWQQAEAMLTDDGYVVLPRLLTAAECVSMARLYAERERFRSRVVMERYAFGRGEYQYFDHPLPELVCELRTSLYRHLAPIANRWHTAMRMHAQFPAAHRDFIEICRSKGQNRPTPLMLRYEADDYTCLHQDLYGESVFPLQAILLLSRPGEDFEGGELILAESDSKKAGRADVVPLQQGQAVVLAVNSRPEPSGRGFYRVNLRHGVSRLHRGVRQTLGIIFHDAK